MMILQQGSKAPTHVPTTQTDHCATAVGRVFPFSTWILLTGYTCPSRLSIERERERKRCSLHLYRFTQLLLFPLFLSFIHFTHSTQHSFPPWSKNQFHAESSLLETVHVAKLACSLSILETGFLVHR